MTEREIFLAAIELSESAARSAYLDEACGSDADLRERVEALLLSHEQAGSFLGTPVVEPPETDQPTEAYFPNPDAATDDEPLTFLASSERPDSLGRIGHYEILQVLGRGAFGIVFRAFDDVLQRVVTMKVLAPQIAAMSPARKRFLREARMSAQVRHENVVQVYEVGKEPLPFLVMEFIPGETLQQRLDRTGPLDVPQALRIGREIAEGLAAAHATDLIHRDIKPGNVLLEGGQLRVKLTDFGLARAADDASLSQSGFIAGTPMYMAPEQALGRTIDQRADLFSLGSVLYQMVSGRPPFRAKTALSVLKRVAEDQPRPIREIIPETPQWLCDIIAKLHAKDPADRFQSAREVADLLADCECQLQADSKLKDYSRIPRAKTAMRSGMTKRVTVAVFLLLLGTLGILEATGVTKMRSTLMAPATGTDGNVGQANRPQPKNETDADLESRQAEFRARWRESAKAHLEAVQQNPADRYTWIQAAPQLILAGDDQAYRQLCRDMLKRFRGTTKADLADSLCKVCLLRPGVVDVSELPAQRVRKATAEPGWEAFRDFFIACAALISYRENNFPQAVNWAERLGEGASQPELMTQAIRTMALQRLGDTKRAREALARLEAAFPAEVRRFSRAAPRDVVPFPDVPVGHDWWYPIILHREAVALVGGTPKEAAAPKAISSPSPSR